MTLSSRQRLILWLAVHGTIRGAADEPTPPAAAPDPVALQSQIDELKEQVAESNRTAEFWAGKARAGAPAAPAAAAEDEPDVLEAITTGGVKGFDALAEKRGFVRKADVQSMIDAKATTLTREQTLMAEYPDLKNKGSEFFKSTAVRYGQLVQDGMNQSQAMETAARETELGFIRSGKIKLPGAEPTKAEKEAERLQRIAAQGGEGGGRRPSAATEEDTELDAQQLHIVRSMLVGQPGPDGKPMTEEQAIDKYKTRAKAGVAIKGQGR